MAFSGRSLFSSEKARSLCHVDSERVKIIILFLTGSPLFPHNSYWNRLQKRLASNPQPAEPSKSIFTKL